MQLNPFDTEWPRATMSDVMRAMNSERGRPLAPIDRARLDFLQHEPATWRCELVDAQNDIGPLPCRLRFVGSPEFGMRTITWTD